MSRDDNRPVPSGQHTPMLAPVWKAASLSVGAAVVVGVLIFWGLSAATAADDATVDVIRTSLAVAGFFGVVLAGVYAYRKHRLAEGDAHRADAEQFASRYTTAAGQLGHDSAAVRLAGVYALARLADDWRDQRRVCIEVLCAYLRLPYEPDPASEKHREGEGAVRQSVIRVIRDHLQNPASPTTWCGYDLDFRGAVFDGGSFDNAVFNGGRVNFDGATFTGSLDGEQTTREMMSFMGAVFDGSDVSFYKAIFSGARSPLTGRRCPGASSSSKKRRSAEATCISAASCTAEAASRSPGRHAPVVTLVGGRSRLKWTTNFFRTSENARRPVERWKALRPADGVYAVAYGIRA